MVEWIDTQARLENVLSESAPPWLALDTEFIRERTFFPQLALIQIRIGERIALIDPQAFETAPAMLLQRLRGSVPVVMHSASEDLECLQHRYGVLPVQLFDTQRAAALSGLDPALSYQRLVQTLLGVSLAKGETRSNWMQRPLTNAQKDYAANDVRYLPALYTLLEDRLRELGRLGWLEEDAAIALAQAADTAADPWPHLVVKQAARMGPTEQARLSAALRWREAEARRCDRPRGWILDTAVAVDLAVAPADRQEFERILDGASRSPRRGRDELWEVLCAASRSAGSTFPHVSVDSEASRAQVRRLQSVVRDVAERVGIAESVLFPRRLIDALLRTRCWPDGAGHWRKELLGELLLAHLA